MVSIVLVKKGRLCVFDEDGSEQRCLFVFVDQVSQIDSIVV